MKNIDTVAPVSSVIILQIIQCIYVYVFLFDYYKFHKTFNKSPNQLDSRLVKCMIYSYTIIV